MGKGDKKSRRGKIILGTFGVRRPRKNAGKIDKTAKPDAEIKERKLQREKKEVPVAKESKPVRPLKEETKPVVREAKAEKEVVKPAPKARAGADPAVAGTEAEPKEKKESKTTRQPKEKKEAKSKKEKKD